MKRIKLLVNMFIACLISISALHAQVSINNDGSDPNDNAMLEVKATGKGFLPPRMTLGNRPTGVQGLLYYQTNSTPGFYFYDGSWKRLGLASSDYWQASGSDIYFNSGDVGIGNSSPIGKLQIHDEISNASLYITSGFNDSSRVFFGEGTTAQHGMFWLYDGWQDNMELWSQVNYTPQGPHIVVDRDNGFVGIGAANPERRLEINGDWNDVRLSSSYNSGVAIEYNGTVSPDWYIGTWGGTIRFGSSTDNFSTTAEDYFFSTTAFRPFDNDTKNLGSPSYRWKGTYSIDGDFSEDVNVGNIINMNNQVELGTLNGKLMVHDPNNSYATLYITPQSTTSDDDASIFLAEDANADYGMYWFYDGSDNALKLYGKLLSTTYGPHMYIDRATGDVGLGVTSPSSKLDVKGNITVRNSSGTVVMELGSGLDYAEGFDVSDDFKVEPGAVLCIDPENPGKLMISNRAYDKKVAGIVAGANGLGSGVKLGVGEYDHNVALAGRVYCNVETIVSPIEPGDLLTTSSIPGYAMKAENEQDFNGAILGKAMEGLPKGEKGKILVLVTLQ